MDSISTLKKPVSANTKIDSFELEALSNKSGNSHNGERKSEETVVEMSAKALASLRDPWYRNDSL